MYNQVLKTEIKKDGWQTVGRIESVSLPLKGLVTKVQLSVKIML